MSETSGRLEPGTRVGERYVVEALLGAGGLAEVYRVRHLELGSVHALKVLKAPARGLADRLLQEGQAQARLAHPNVVRITDVLRVNAGGREAPALLMELVEGPPLDVYLARHGALPLDDGLALFAQVLSAVASAHEAGVLHRALGPGNVLLAPVPTGFEPRITDFGVAKVLDDELGGGKPPRYAAPEQVRGGAAVDVRTDVFALGALLFELVTGEDPLRAGAEADPPRLDQVRPDVPARIADAVAVALSRDREARHPDCAAFRRALGLAEPPASAVTRDEPSSAAATAPPAASREAAPRPPGPATLPPEPAPGTSGRLVVAGIFGSVLAALVLAGVFVVLFGSGIRTRADRPAPGVAQPPPPLEIAPAPPVETPVVDPGALSPAEEREGEGDVAPGTDETDPPGEADPRR